MPNLGPKRRGLEERTHPCLSMDETPLPTVKLSLTLGRPRTRAYSDVSRLSPAFTGRGSRGKMKRANKWRAKPLAKE
jgi:hypothetical protein